MVTPEGHTTFSLIKEPKGDPRLKDFSTGDRTEWECAVNDLVLELYEDGLARYPRIRMLAMTDGSGETLGLCAWRPKKLEPTTGPYEEPPYVHLIGVSERFRRPHEDDGAPSIGSALLVQALKEIRIQWNTSVMPDVWALVHRDNDESHQLFARHGFSLVKRNAGDDRRYRPPKLPIQ
jgi:hypothetical protein